MHDHCFELVKEPCFTDSINVLSDFFCRQLAIVSNALLWVAWALWMIFVLCVVCVIYSTPSFRHRYFRIATMCWHDSPQFSNSGSQLGVATGKWQVLQFCQKGELCGKIQIVVGICGVLGCRACMWGPHPANSLWYSYFVMLHFSEALFRIQSECPWRSALSRTDFTCLQRCSLPFAHWICSPSPTHFTLPIHL